MTIEYVMPDERPEGICREFSRACDQPAIEDDRCAAHLAEKKALFERLKQYQPTLGEEPSKQ